MLTNSHRQSVVARGAVISVLRNTFSGKKLDGCHDNRVIQTLHSLPEILGKVSRFNYRVNSRVLVSQASPSVYYSCDHVTKDVMAPGKSGTRNDISEKYTSHNTLLPKGTG